MRVQNSAHAHNPFRWRAPASSSLVRLPGAPAGDAEPALLPAAPTSGRGRVGRPKGAVQKCDSCRKKGRECGPDCAGWPGHQPATSVVTPPPTAAGAAVTPPQLAVSFSTDAAAQPRGEPSAAAPQSAEGQDRRRRASRDLDAADPEASTLRHWAPHRCMATFKSSQSRRLTRRPSLASSRCTSSLSRTASSTSTTLLARFSLITRTAA